MLRQIVVSATPSPATCPDPMIPSPKTPRVHPETTDSTSHRPLVPSFALPLIGWDPPQPSHHYSRDQNQQHPHTPFYPLSTFLVSTTTVSFPVVRVGTIWNATQSPGYPSQRATATPSFSQRPSQPLMSISPPPPQASLLAPRVLNIRVSRGYRDPYCSGLLLSASLCASGFRGVRHTWSGAPSIRGPQHRHV